MMARRGYAWLSAAVALCIFYAAVAAPLPPRPKRSLQEDHNLLSDQKDPQGDPHYVHWYSSASIEVMSDGKPAVVNICLQFVANNG